jgi:hypothetical protein
MLTVQKEAVEKILAAAHQAKNQIKSVVGQRHYVVGLGGEPGVREDLYWVLLHAEAALEGLERMAREVSDPPIESRCAIPEGVHKDQKG